MVVDGVHVAFEVQKALGDGHVAHLRRDVQRRPPEVVPDIRLVDGLEPQLELLLVAVPRRKPFKDPSQNILKYLLHSAISP